MKRNILVAIDVDGTLRCNCKPDCIDPNKDIVHLANTLARFKNVRVMIWSGNGKDYADNTIRRYGLQRCFGASKIDESTWVCGRPQIAIDDIETFSLGVYNLIIREK